MFVTSVYRLETPFFMSKFLSAFFRTGPTVVSQTYRPVIIVGRTLFYNLLFISKVTDKT